mmetsp:Transcript_3312/g.6223  ORF Transcript_3312/g.6223 Transcript_3312/m.6223 type:complete len:88 (-) Transcript_3312:232-495(-)
MSTSAQVTDVVLRIGSKTTEEVELLPHIKISAVSFSMVRRTDAWKIPKLVSFRHYDSILYRQATGVCEFKLKLHWMCSLLLYNEQNA